MKILQTYTGQDYEINDDQVATIQKESKLGKVGGIWIGTDYVAFGSIRGVTDLKENKNPYPELPAVGMVGIITKTKRLSSLEALGRGLKTSIDKMRGMDIGRDTKKAEELLLMVRKRY